MDPPMNVTVIRSVAGLDQVREFLSATPIFGLDIETNVTERLGERYIRTIQVGDRERQFVIDLLPIAGSLDDLRAEQGHDGTRINRLRPVVELLTPFLDSKTHLKVGHRLSFEYSCFRWCLGIYLWRVYDTALAEQVLYAGAVPFSIKGYWALKDLAARYLQLDVSKELQQSFGTDAEITAEQAIYGAVDARIVLGIRARQLGAISKAKLDRTIEIEMDALPMFGELHTNGIRVDPDLWRIAAVGAKNALVTALANLDALFVPVLGEKTELHADLDELDRLWRAEKDREQRKIARKAFMDARRGVKQRQKDLLTYEGRAPINYASQPQLLKHMVAAGGPKISNTSNETLLKHRNNPVIRAIVAYREAKKLLTSYGDGFLAHIDPITGRIHPNFIQIGAATGRSAVSSPNIQQIPRDGAFRKAFVPPAGGVFVVCDMAGAELRILAELSKCQPWIEAFANGKDVHSITAALLRPEEWLAAAGPDCEFAKTQQKCSCPAHLDLRDKTKTIAFLVLYGGGSGKLSLMLNITASAAQELLKEHRRAVPDVWYYLEASAWSARTRMQARTIIGRRRLFPEPTPEMILAQAMEDVKDAGDEAKWEANKITQNYRGVSMTYREKMLESAKRGLYAAVAREGRNAVIQGTNADIAKRAMGAGHDADGKPYLWHQLRAARAKAVNFVHDEIDIECPAERGAEVLQWVKDAILRAGAEQLKLVRMEASGHTATCWEK
jgi:DNA polymerase I-like protein with 3'-5' exonuclease and polymerase domains